MHVWKPGESTICLSVKSKSVQKAPFSSRLVSRGQKPFQMCVWKPKESALYTYPYENPLQQTHPSTHGFPGVFQKCVWKPKEKWDMLRSQKEVCVERTHLSTHSFHKVFQGCVRKPKEKVHTRNSQEKKKQTTARKRLSTNNFFPEGREACSTVCV